MNFKDTYKMKIYSVGLFVYSNKNEQLQEPCVNEVIAPIFMQTPIIDNSSQAIKPLLKVWRSGNEICLEKLKSGDKESFKILYKMYSSALYGSIIRDVKNKKKSNEILENTFLYAWQNISSFDESKSKIFTWLLKAGKEISNRKV